jgi:hypothetical protein
MHHDWKAHKPGSFRTPFYCSAPLPSDTAELEARQALESVFFFNGLPRRFCNTAIDYSPVVFAPWRASLPCVIFCIRGAGFFEIN